MYRFVRNQLHNSCSGLRNKNVNLAAVPGAAMLFWTREAPTPANIRSAKEGPPCFLEYSLGIKLYIADKYE